MFMARFVVELIAGAGGHAAARIFCQSLEAETRFHCREHIVLQMISLNMW